MKSRQISFSPPDIREEDIENVIEALKSGWITTGPKVKEFERELVSFLDCDGVVALNSCTAALEAAINFMGIGPGDEVIVPAYTYTASASPVCHVGAKVVFIDIEKDRPVMDLEAVKAAINENTKAIVPVDLGGVMENYEEIFKIVESKKDIFKPGNDKQKALGRIAILADCAHSLGATRKGRKAGSVADFSSFSFHAVKNLTTAEGGCVSWRKGLPWKYEDIYKEIQLFSLHGQSKDALAKNKPGAWEYDIVMPGYKCNMTDIQAGLGLSQLKRYGEIEDRRHSICNKYDKEIVEKFGLSSLKHDGEAFKSSAHLYQLILNFHQVEKRNAFITAMAERGIACNVHYKPLPMMSAYKNLGWDINNFPNAYNYYVDEVSLPLHTVLTDDDVEYIIENVGEVIRELS